MKGNLIKNKNFKSISIVSGVVLGMVMIVYLATSVVPKALITLSQASSVGEVVVNGSYLIGEKILAKADGKDSNLVNIFLLDKNGKGVSGKTVELTGMDAGVDQVNSLSNIDGKISFKLTSTNEKQYRINALYNGQELPQTIVVTFRN